MGRAVLMVFRHAPDLHAGPVRRLPAVGAAALCLGLYEVSRRLERGEAVTLSDALVGLAGQSAADRHLRHGACSSLKCSGRRAALIVFAVSFNGMPDFAGSILKLLDAANLGFIVAYLGVGSLFAGLIFGCQRDRHAAAPGPPHRRRSAPDLPASSSA